MEIISKKIKRVYNKIDFLDAIKNSDIGTIILDCDEIDFYKNRKIIINRSLAIYGTAKISQVKFVITNNSMLVIGENLFIYNKKHNPIYAQNGSSFVTNNDF